MTKSTQFQIELFDLLFRLDITIEARVKVFQRLNRFKSELLCIQKNTKAFKIALSQEIIPNIQIQVLVYKWILSELMKDSDSYAYLFDRIKKLQNRIKTKRFSYSLNPQSTLNLDTLFLELVGNQMISRETKFESFERIFNDFPIEEIEPIVWSSGIASELLYFVNLIEKQTNKIWSRYQRIEDCFIMPNGNRFNVNWKQLNQMIDVNLSQDKQSVIEFVIVKSSQNCT